MNKKHMIWLALFLSFSLLFASVPVWAAVVTDITDSDTDKVYFDGDTISFTISGDELQPLNGQYVRVAFGVNDGGGFTSCGIISGLSDGGGYYYKNALVSGGTISFANETITNPGDSTYVGALGVQLYISMDGGNTWNPSGPAFTVQTSGGVSRPALVGIHVPAGSVAVTPALSEIGNLYNTECAVKFSGTSNGITGEIQFNPGLDIIGHKEELNNLQGAITLLGAINLITNEITYVVGIDTGSLTFLSGLGASVNIKDLPEGLADVTVLPPPGGVASNLSYSGTTCTFDVNHFSDYTMSGKMVPTDLAQSASFTDTDNDEGEIGGDVTWTGAADESNITNYVVYYLAADNSKVGAAVGEVAQGGTYRVSIPANTAIPGSAVKFGVYSKNNAGESITARTVNIVDACLPSALARDASFTDADLDQGEIGGDVTWTGAANESNITHYVVYYLAADNSKVGAAVGEVAKGGTYRVSISANTAIPGSAVKFGVYSKNAIGESTSASTASIVDKAVPTAAATNAVFTDNDKNGGQIGGNITWTLASPEAGITGYKVYFVGSSNNKIGSAVGTVAAGTNSYAIAENTAIPAGAVKLGVYSYNGDGDCATGALVNINDDSSGDSSGGGSDTGTGASLQAKDSPISNEVKTADDRALDQSLKASGEAKVSLAAKSEPKAELSPAVVNTLMLENKPLIIENAGIKVEFGGRSLVTAELTGEFQNQNAVLELGAREISAAEKQEVLDKAPLGNSTGLFEIGGKMVDLTAGIKTVNPDGTTGISKIGSFGEPVAVTIDLSSLGELNPTQIAQLTAVRFEKDSAGNINPVKIGGNYDPVTKTFTFYTDKFSLYSVLQAAKLVKIKLAVDAPNAIVNGANRAIDVSPVIINGRAMVPVRFVGESIGAEINWNGKTRTVRIKLDGREINLTVGQTGPGLDTPATIVNNRTLVPVRYVSESLGASVLWFPSTKGVEIIK